MLFDCRLTFNTKQITSGRTQDLNVNVYILVRGKYLVTDIALLGSRKRLLCPHFVKYLPGVLKKDTKVLDIFYTDKKGFIKINVD